MRKLEFFKDNKILMGIGIGLILGVILMFNYHYKNSLSDYEIEQRARELGMVYENEVKAILKGVDEK